MDGQARADFQIENGTVLFHCIAVMIRQRGEEVL